MVQNDDQKKIVGGCIDRRNAGGTLVSVPLDLDTLEVGVAATVHPVS